MIRDKVPLIVIIVYHIRRYDYFSGEADEHETKLVLNQGINIIDEHSMESDEDQRVVDHLSPQTLLETPNDNDVQYSFRSPEGRFKNCLYI